jgi:hypothetical protein
MTVYCPPDLRALYREGRLIPFVGAGVSTSVQWLSAGLLKRGPSWRELVDQAARYLGFTDPDLLRVRGTDLQILEYFHAKRSGFGQLHQWLVREMAPPDDALRASPIHQRLAALDRCRLLYTTNYDDLIERAFSLLGRRCHTVVIEPDMGRFDSDPRACELVKFHGDLLHPDTMVLSESDYENRLSLRTPMDFRLRSDVLGRALLFIGYSFRDWNVSYLFRLVNDEFGTLPDSLSGRRAYITVPEPSDFEFRLFQRRNIEVIPVSSATTTADISELLEEVTKV